MVLQLLQLLSEHALVRHPRCSNGQPLFGNVEVYSVQEILLFAAKACLLLWFVRDVLVDLNIFGSGLW